MPARPIRLAVIGCAAVLALTAGCARNTGSNGTGALGSTTPTTAPATTPPADPGDGGTPAASPTDTSSTTPAPSHTPTHTPTTAPVTHSYPDDYASAILTAWASRDSAYLTLLTSAGTAHAILGYGDINTHWTLIRDDGAAGSTYASYYNNGGDEIVIRLANSEVAAHHWHAATVQSWDVMTFPNTATAYARKYVDGWIAGNRARMDLLGTTALTTFYRAMTAPTADYVLHPPFGSGADVEVEFTDPGVDSSLIIHNAALGHQHAITGCDIGC